MNYADEAREGRQNQVYDENDVRQPKGGWENDESQAEAAARETWEEAGVRGTITSHIGTFVETTKKGNAKANHWIYEMHINEIMKKWPEKKKRERRWFTLEEALAVTATKPYMQEAIRLSSIAKAVRK
ncbi:unnamed protein product [Umbelopsis vinacea]